MTTLTLTAPQRAQYKKSLLRAGVTTAGLNDDQLAAEYRKLSGEPLNNEQSAPAIIEQPAEVPAPAVIEQQPEAHPVNEQQQINLPNGGTITINVAAGATLNININH